MAARSGQLLFCLDEFWLKVGNLRQGGDLFEDQMGVVDPGRRVGHVVRVKHYNRAYIFLELNAPIAQSQ